MTMLGRRIAPLNLLSQRPTSIDRFNVLKRHFLWTPGKTILHHIQQDPWNCILGSTNR